MFTGKKILIGVTGGIAAYKTCEVVRELKKNNAQVRTVMTKAARNFVGPLTFETLSDNPVLLDLFPKEGRRGTIHIEAARWPDCVLVCPATANIIGKVTSGIADDTLTTIIMATTSQVIFCPAMNKDMYQNPIFQENLRKLRGLGYGFVEPEKGELACGEEGWGRLAEKGRIINFLKRALLSSKELSGQRVLVTAGRTEEPIDPVRLITNRSTGKMGFALAEAAALRGAEVTLISGPNNLEVFAGVKYREVRRAAEMADAVMEEFESSDVLIMAAAVADFRPKDYSPTKIKKLEKATLELEMTQDILLEAGRRKGERILVGFAVETDQGLENAKAKLRKKNLDLVVLNNPLEEGAGFAVDTNKVTLVDTKGKVEHLPQLSKREVAERVLDRVVDLRTLEK